jgi:hypothetical protein
LFSNSTQIKFSLAKNPLSTQNPSMSSMAGYNSYG